MLPILALLVASPAHAGAKASSFQPESKKGSNYWNAGNAIDGKAETAWSLPGDSANRGEWILLDVPKGELEKVGIVPGWDRDEETFTDYPRVKQVRVDVYTLDNDSVDQLVGSETLDVADKRGMQIIPLKTRLKIGVDSMFGGRVKLTVLDVYDGQDFPNLRVSEVAAFLAEIDATPKITSHEAPELSDASPKTVWKGAAGASFVVDPQGWALSSIGFQGDKGAGRAKTVKVVVGDRPEQTFTLNDKPDLQWINLAPHNGYVGSTIDTVTITVVDSHGADIGLSELKFRATHYEPL